ncbi:hypothetical protein MNBD_PLANCTO03-1345 [hydrothermal vent metagenome]|uniref:Uncharacterized protein n=1 Tax=hydrothermal vent metagenome TaxID=652676 RepID=A0A3B1DIG5_9ZZZZ
MERRPVSQRLGMYLFGVAIGLVLVGYLLSVRGRFAQQGPAEPTPIPTPAATSPAAAEPTP